MRKTSEEITREVFGKGSRWIGWDNWFRHQPIFTYIQKKVDQGLEVLSTRDFFVKDQGGTFKDCIMVCINNRTGSLETVWLSSGLEEGGLLLKEKSTSYYPTNDTEISTHLAEMFDDPWRPTLEELDLFELLYGDEQMLIDMDRKFYGTVLAYNKAVLKGTAKIVFMDQ